MKAAAAVVLALGAMALLGWFFSRVGPLLSGLILDYPP